MSTCKHANTYCICAAYADFQVNWALASGVLHGDMGAGHICAGPVHGLLVPKTIGTGLLVPQPMDDWYLR